MRRILDALAWVFVVSMIAAAFYISNAKSETTPEVAEHEHVTEAQRAACQSCRTAAHIQEVDAAVPIRTVRAF
jgi:hypothetical protein